MKCEYSLFNPSHQLLVIGLYPHAINNSTVIQLKEIMKATKFLKIPWHEIELIRSNLYERILTIYGNEYDPFQVNGISKHDYTQLLVNFIESQQAKELWGVLPVEVQNALINGFLTCIKQESISFPDADSFIKRYNAHVSTCFLVVIYFPFQF